MATLEEALGLEAAPAGQGQSLEAALGLEAEAPSLLERIGQGVQSGIQGIGEFITEAPGATLSGLKTIGGIATGQPDFERLKGTAKGAGQALSLGLYQPEFSSEAEADAARGGRLAGGIGLGMGLGKVVSPLAAKLLEKLSPLGRTAKVLTKTAEASAYSAPGAAATAIQGGDPVEGFTAGMTAAGLGSTVAGLAQRSAKFLAQPAKQAVDKAAFNQTVEASRYMDWKWQMDELAQIKQRNTGVMDTYRTAVAEAQTKLATGQAGAVESYHNALMQLKQAEKGLSTLELQASTQAQKLRPKMTPQEAYMEYNAARMTPEILPEVELTNTSSTVSRLGGNLSRSTEGLPKAAGPSGSLEKLAIGLDEAITGGDKPKFRPEVQNYFGGSWGKLSDVQKLKMNQQYLDNLGISGDDLAVISSGKLRLDQADRVLQLVGPKAGDSGLASRLYWSIMEDLRGSKDPMVKGFLQAKATQRQDIAAGDLAQKLQPVTDAFGRETISGAELRKVTTAFRNFDRDPKLLKWDDRLLVESIPAIERQPFIDFIGKIFKAREDVATSKQLVKAAIPKAGKVEAVAKPKLESEVFPNVPEALRLREVPMKYQPTGYNDPQTHYAIARIAGWHIPFAIIASRGVAILERMIFRAGMDANGRAFVKNLYRDSSPSIGDTAKAMALANFIRTMNQAEQQMVQ